MKLIYSLSIYFTPSKQGSPVTFIFKILCNNTRTVFFYWEKTFFIYMVDTVFSYGRALIVCEFLQETLKAKKVVCMKSEMQILILRFYLVEQCCQTIFYVFQTYLNSAKIRSPNTRKKRDSTHPNIVNHVSILSCASFKSDGYKKIWETNWSRPRLTLFMCFKLLH